MKKRIGAALTALALVGSMVPSAMAAEVDKTATELVNEKTKVTLSVGGSQQVSVPSSDVVFVLDKSTSMEARAEANAMLDSLNAEVKDKGLDVKAGVVIYSKTAHKTYPLTTVNDDNLAAIKETISDTTYAGGTNLEAGIRAGLEMLNSDSSVSASNKHLVLVSDGVTYMWGTGTPQSIYVDLNNTKAAGVDLVNDYWAFHREVSIENSGDYADAAAWMATAEANGIEALIAEYAVDYTDADDPNIEKSIPNDGSVTNPYSSLEAATYMGGAAWQDAADAGYNLYAYAPDDYLSTYPWAPTFIQGLYTIGDTDTALYTDSAAGVEGMFDNIENSIVYEIQSGVVTDEISPYFDLAGLDTFVMTVGGEELTGTVDPQANTVTFADGAYVVTYDPAADSFTWAINTPVINGKGAALTYELALDKAAVDAAENLDKSQVPTNTGAKLEYTSTDNTAGEEIFPVPTVSLLEKDSEPSMDKTSSGSDVIGDVAPGSSIFFELNSNLPQSMIYDIREVVDDEGNVTYQVRDKENHWLVFHDKMSDNLTFNATSLVVEIGDVELEEGQYMLDTNPTDGCTFELTIDLGALIEAGVITPAQVENSDAVVVSYRAKLSEDAEDGDQISNEAWVNDSESDTTPGEVVDDDEPLTGGAGTMMFTMGGAALLAAAGVLFVVNRRKGWN